MYSLTVKENERNIEIEKEREKEKERGLRRMTLRAKLVFFWTHFPFDMCFDQLIAEPIRNAVLL